MPRQARKPSGTGIHHVMMRGINHQNIFEVVEDYYQFITTLDRVRVQYDDFGLPCGTNCTYYAYCLMSNHFHLLIRERDESIGDTIKRIASSYVYYYNHKYQRDGHLFRERFKSEPVNDPLPDDYYFLDSENEQPRLRLSDDQVWQHIIELTGVRNSSDFQKLDRDKQKESLRTLRDIGASVRQLERLTGVSRGIIQFVKK